jgi:hypothetical protein
VKLSLENLEREVRNLKREIDRISGGGLLVRQDLDMRKFRIVNMGNPEVVGDAATGATAVAATTTTTTVTGGVAGPAASTVNALATWGDASGTTLLSGAGALTSAGALSGLTTISLSGQLTSTLATGTAPLVVASTTQVANLYAARAALADTVTTNANLTGPITSVGNATAVASQTGTGSTFVMSASPTLTGSAVAATLAVDALNLSSGDRIRFDDGTGNIYGLYRNASNQLEFNVNTGGALTATYLMSSAFFGPSTAGEDLGQVAVGWNSLYLDESGAGTQTAQILAPTLASDIIVTLPAATGTLATLAGSEALSNKTYAGSTATLTGLLKASSANFTLGGTELALATDEVAMFTSRAAGSNNAYIAINSGSSGSSGLRFYDDGALTSTLLSSNAGGTTGLTISTDTTAGSAAIVLLDGASGFFRYRDQSGNALIEADHATSATTLRGNLILTGTSSRGFIELGEYATTTDAAAPSADRARLYVRDNGAGKEQLVVRFATGAVQVLATEP